MKIRIILDAVTIVGMRIYSLPELILKMDESFPFYGTVKSFDYKITSHFSVRNDFEIQWISTMKTTLQIISFGKTVDNAS